MTRIAYEELIRFHQAVLEKAGLDQFSKDSVTTGLCETSLRGVDSHGVRLLPHYVRSAVMGRKNPRPNFQFKQRFPTIGVLDADGAFGHAAGMKAIDYAMEMAETMGMGAVSVQNSSHPGAMASFVLKAARKGYMAFAFTHADALLLSTNGTRPFFGTNPVCFAAPREEEEPYCLDMATSGFSWNKLIIYRSNGNELPEGVAADENGDLVTNPADARCLIPTGGYKGYGLASMVEVLCAIYSGMAFGRTIPAMFTTPMDKRRDLGQFYLVMRIDGAVSAEEFKANLQKMTDEVRNEPRKGDEAVMLPGDPQKLESANRAKFGIPFDKPTYDSFLELSEQYGIPLKTL